MRIDDLCRLAREVETRWATAENPDGLRGGSARDGRKGAAWVRLPAGGRYVIAHARGAGVVRRIWLTLAERTPTMLRSLRIDAWWDGCARPAISAPLGDFFGIGLGRVVPFASALFGSPEGRSWVCLAPMPFRDGMRIAITNDGDRDVPELYSDVAYTLGDRHDDDVAYLHAHWRRERRTTPRRDYELLPLVAGRGRFLGVNVGVIADRDAWFGTWWGEGECKLFLDGDEERATLCGTGTEDYVGTGWELGAFAHPYHGCTVADHARMRFCFYRWHVPDPVWFARDVRATIQQIGNYGPEAKARLLASGRRFDLAGAEPRVLDASSPQCGLLERSDDWSSCAYWYLDRPENALPPLAPLAERTHGIES